MVESNDFNEDDDIIVTIRLLFKGNQVGTIIGRKGSKITQIREESACEIKVKGNDQDIERTVSVHGSPSG
jgi:predicted PilT family ATPase